MKKAVLISLAFIGLFTLAGFSANNNELEPTPIPVSKQRTGDTEKGYEYLVTGNYVSSGIPYKVFIRAFGKAKTNHLNRSGKNANVLYSYNVIKSRGLDVVAPTCLQCHAQVFDGKLYVGLGNVNADFSRDTKAGNWKIKMMRFTMPKVYRSAEPFFRAYRATHGKMKAEVRGVNVADRLAAILVAHRDPQTLKWTDDPLLDIPDEVYPTDVPAWWLLKKKNAMFYNGFGRGDFAKFLMASNLLTVRDTAEANEVNSHFGDVLAYIRSIEPPKYPQAIDNDLAANGRVVFNDNCSRCHGTYGDKGHYPNLLIPEEIIGTDSMLFKANQQNPQFIDWFNRSWFAKAPHAAKLVPYNGYIAPPLDGVWITAPYLHNGSVPNLETLLDSKTRPTYWNRAYIYDYEKIGWDFGTHTAAGNKAIYNTTLPGYGNQGHYFGDHLTTSERKAVIEYLKTL